MTTDNSIPIGLWSGQLAELRIAEFQLSGCSCATEAFGQSTAGCPVHGVVRFGHRLSSTSWDGKRGGKRGGKK